MELASYRKKLDTDSVGEERSWLCSRREVASRADFQVGRFRLLKCHFPCCRSSFWKPNGQCFTESAPRFTHHVGVKCGSPFFPHTLQPRFPSCSQIGHPLTHCGPLTTLGLAHQTLHGLQRWGPPCPRLPRFVLSLRKLRSPRIRKPTCQVFAANTLRFPLPPLEITWCRQSGRAGVPSWAQWSLQAVGDRGPGALP